MKNSRSKTHLKGIASIVIAGFLSGSCGALSGLMGLGGDDSADLSPNSSSDYLGLTSSDGLALAKSDVSYKKLGVVPTSSAQNANADGGSLYGIFPVQ